MKRLLPLLLLLLLAIPARGQEWVTAWDRFRLYTGCADVYLGVEDIPTNDARLTKSQVQITGRSRLRGARIYKDAALTPYLYVNVNVVGNAFNISVEFNKWLTDEWGEGGTGVTWHKAMAGTYSGSSGFILQGVGQLVDIFIDEYLRVNAEACE